MLEGLNANQSKAAMQVEGPVIVFAGAGSGKTRTLTFRILNMIVNCHINPYNILAITFTNKATNVMKERLGAYKDVNVRALTINTFHALCAMILRRDIEYLGYTRDFNIVDEEEQLKVVSEVVKELGYDKKSAKKYQKSINYHKCFLLKPQDRAEIKVYDKYQEKMKELNMLDFEDLLIKVYELFSLFPEVLFKYQEKYKYILIDEFQDTNLVQYKIAKLLASKYRNIFVVGDDDQSIYSFRGTNYENIRLFKDDFYEYNSFTLNENYRSTQTILDHANRLIEHNIDREPKQMITNISGNMDDVIFQCFENEQKEADFIIRKIKALKSRSNQYSDFAVLYRSSVLLRNVELAMIKHEIPYKVYGGLSYLRRKEVKDIIAYFKLMINPKDVLAFKRIINLPARGIGLATIEKIDAIHRSQKVDFLKAIELAETIMPKSKFNVLNLFRLMIINYQKRILEESLLDVFNDLIDEIKYIDYLKEEYGEEEAKERIDNVNEFKSVLYNLESENPELTPIERLRKAFDDGVLSDEYLQNQKEKAYGVTLSTIHSVKGLEFNVVFLIGLEENIFPNTNRIESDSELEEERRIAYVAMTRAKSKLFLTATTQRLLYGSRFYNEHSRFVDEALGINTNSDFEDAQIASSYPQKYQKYNNNYNNYTHNNDTKFDDLPTYQITTESEKSVSNDNNESPDYQISDEILHKKFGEGIIIGIDNGVGNVFFKKEKTTKKIILNHPSVTKLK